MLTLNFWLPSITNSVSPPCGGGGDGNGGDERGRRRGRARAGGQLVWDLHSKVGVEWRCLHLVEPDLRLSVDRDLDISLDYEVRGIRTHLVEQSYESRGWAPRL